MWRIQPRDISRRFQGDGDSFTEFVDAVLRARAAALGIPAAAIQTNPRSSQRDGGVDALMDGANASDGDDWLRSPTIWQYKAGRHRADHGVDEQNRALEAELRKPFSSRCLSTGHAYRFCICDELPAQKTTDWEDTLTLAALDINPNSPRARVLDTSDLAVLASRYPGIALRFFGRAGRGAGFPLEVWERNLRQQTPTFVQVPAWSAAWSAIGDHLDLTSAVADVVLPVQGQAGVGKTRVVLERVSVEPHLRDRFPLRSAERDVIEALALVTRLGFSRDVSGELEALCELVGLDSALFGETANRLHDVPGFVGRGGRYLYVTPEIIAQVAFESAWRRWSEPDVRGFLSRIPLALSQPFKRRVERSASEEIRREVADFFPRGSLA